MTNFVIPFGVREKHACFELPISPAVAVLMHNLNEDIWKFHGSLTLNKGNLLDILEDFAMSLGQI